MSNTVETLVTLAGFNTVSACSNETLIRYAAQRITDAGGSIHTLAGALPGKFNLLASFGPSTGDGLVLCGHSDVVPVTGQDWHSDPFSLTEKDGALYARGSSDMKGFLAAMLTAAERCDIAKLNRPLHLVFSYDEEIGCVGVRDLLTRMEKSGFTAQAAVIGEPTEMRVVNGHKGKIAGCICCRGKAAHSANPVLGCNAVTMAGEMLGEMTKLQSELAASRRDDAYPFPHTSLQPGIIKGGIATNIVPDRCEIGFEIRYLAGEDTDAILQHLRAEGGKLADRHPGGAVELRITSDYPGMQLSDDAEIIGIALNAAGQSQTHKIDFGTEAGLFTEMLGVETIICGPGSIDRAHKPDEYITRHELAACDDFLDRLIATLS